MKQHCHYSKFALLFALIFTSFSCQESLVNEDIDLLDKDMTTAIQLADEYLKATNAREGSGKCVTVLKYQDGKLLYASNTDSNGGYEEVNEETVTASVTEGEYVFWFSGGGLTDLDGIEFDSLSQDELNELPEEINPDKMWVISIPEDAALIETNDENISYLKYDILYQHTDNDGEVIRLDPKIQVTH